jgi:hypothetical protein
MAIEQTTTELYLTFAMPPTLMTQNFKKNGALMGIAGAPLEVRNPDSNCIQTKNAAFMSSSLPIVGFAVVEAAYTAEATKLISQSPCAVAHGVVEIWPLLDS